jgi:hypothetical protein
VIPTLEAFGLLKKLGELPLDPVVEALRDLHQRGDVDSPRLRQLVGTPAVESAPPVRTPERQATSPDYEAARRHFVDHSRKLREQALLAERLLDGLVSRDTARTPALQSEVTVTCPRHGSSGARFAVANRLDHPIDVRFRVAHIQGRADPSETAVVSFEPATPRLDTGEEAVVRLLVDLSGVRDAGHTLDVAVDVVGGERLLFKLWVRIDVRDEEAGHGARTE